MTWEVFAIRYAAQSERTRGANFLYVPDHDAPSPIDFFMWLLRRGDETILVDTGYDAAEAAARGRSLTLDPAAALAPFGLTPEAVDRIVLTHLHFDHAGGLHLFPNATLHLQDSEMAYATGRCMCEPVLRAPFTADHVCEAVRRVHRGRVVFHDGDGAVADGVTVHRIGGHTGGLQCVRVRTGAGWLVLASDAAHFYENMHAGLPFPLVVDMAEMLAGFRILDRLASAPGLIVPGHDPRVRELFPGGPAPETWRLDRGPLRDPQS